MDDEVKLLRLLAAAVACDGHLDVLERRYLERFAERRGLGRDVAAETLREVSQGGKVAIPAPQAAAERLAVLDAAVQVACCDGEVAPEELRLLDRIGKTLGFSQGEVEELTARRFEELEYGPDAVAGAGAAAATAAKAAAKAGVVTAGVGAGVGAGLGCSATVVAVVVGVVLLVAGVVVLGLLFLLGAGAAHGRPFRVRGRARVAAATAGGSWLGAVARPAVLGLDAALRRRLGEEWLRDALAEHASVPAFARLSLDLVSLGAPARLVEGCHRAALDEVRHARRCFALASAYAGAPRSAGPLPEAAAPAPCEGPADRRARVALEALVDGCLNEGIAAAVAEAAAAGTRDPAPRDVLAGIARDERRHAELAWSVLAWSLAAGGPPVARAVERALARLRVPAAWLAGDRAAPPDLAAHGRASPGTRRRCAEATRAAVALRASRLLAAAPAGASPDLSPESARLAFRTDVGDGSGRSWHLATGGLGADSVSARARMGPRPQGAIRQVLERIPSRPRNEAVRDPGWGAA